MKPITEMAIKYEAPVADVRLFGSEVRICADSLNNNESFGTIPGGSFDF